MKIYFIGKFTDIGQINSDENAALYLVKNIDINKNITLKVLNMNEINFEKNLSVNYIYSGYNKYLKYNFNSKI